MENIRSTESIIYTKCKLSDTRQDIGWQGNKNKDGEEAGNKDKVKD